MHKNGNSNKVVPLKSSIQAEQSVVKHHIQAGGRDNCSVWSSLKDDDDDGLAEECRLWSSWMSTSGIWRLR